MARPVQERGKEPYGGDADGNRPQRD